MKFLNGALASAMIALSACGGGGGSTSSDNGGETPVSPTVNTGVFLDAAVVSIDYRTETIEGTTTSGGEYDYLEGETVTFFIGDLEFPAVQAKAVVTPLDLADSTNPEDDTVVNILRLLQTLDEDGDASNGIHISDSAKGAATQVNFSQSVSDFENAASVTNLVANSGSTHTSLISVEAAVEHFEAQLEDNGIDFGEVEGVWELVGESVIFMHFDGDRYFGLQWQEENDFIGFERGSFADTEEALTYTVAQNNDGEALLCNLPADSSCGENSLAYSLAGDYLTFELEGEGNIDFDRVLVDASGIEGLWEFEGESVLFLFLPDGRYFGVQWIEENDFIGFERGTYTVANDTLTINTQQNHDGEALMCNRPTNMGCSNNTLVYSLSGDTLSLLFGDESRVQLVKRL